MTLTGAPVNFSRATARKRVGLGRGLMPVECVWRARPSLAKLIGANRPGFGEVLYRRMKHADAVPSRVPPARLAAAGRGSTTRSVRDGVGGYHSGGVTAEGEQRTLRKWLRRSEVDAGTRPGTTSEELAEVRRLKRENAELRRTNEILRTASAFFAAELDRPAPR